MLAFAGDATVELWSVPAFASRGVLRGHAAVVRDIGFSSDGSLIVTAGSDGTIRIWEAGTLENVQVIREANVASAKFVSGTNVIARGRTGLEAAKPWATIRLTVCDVCAPRKRLLQLVDERQTRALDIEERRRYLHE